VTKEEKQERAVSFAGWYHQIDLGDGVVTEPKWPDMIPQWEQVRAVRAGIDYTNKLVLDLGCADGMWAFEAEKLGARRVVAADMAPPEYIERMLFARFCLDSKVIPYFGVRVETLLERAETFANYFTGGEKFDIVQHLGLLYHQRDVFQSLLQARRCMKTGGTLLLETAIYIDSYKEPVALLNKDMRIYNDATTWWAPNLPCLLEMLRLSLFESNESEVKVLSQKGTVGENAVGRVCVKAVAQSLNSLPSAYVQELGYSILGFEPEFGSKPWLE
jgi:tRNA (mo5U34)-methyltransferase